MEKVLVFSLCILTSTSIFVRVLSNPSQDVAAAWMHGIVAGASRPMCPCNRVQPEGSSDMSDASQPLMSRTPSSICPTSPIHQEIIPDNSDRLDDIDGLPIINCHVQLRVQQIILDHKVNL